VVLIDRTLQALVDLTLSCRPDSKSLHEVKRRVLDSLGCYFGAWMESSTSVAHESARKYGVSTDGATVWGLGVKATLDWAAFANAVGVRALDFNDTYLSLEPLHPSDIIPSVMAVAENLGSSGVEFLEAVAVGYEVGCRLCDSATLRRRGWDHVNYTMVASAAALARLLRLTPEQAKNAISLSIVPHIAMRQTRAGELSMWKGAAAANACRNAVFAVLLARRGMTGPDQPFEGEMGFFKQVSGTAFPSEIWSDPYRCDAIMKTHIKYHPVEYHAQSAVDAAIAIYSEIGGPAGIEKVRVETFEASYTILVKDREKWYPRTRETADHSLPYIVAAALHDGEIWMDTFSQEHLSSRGIRGIMDVMEVVEDRELTMRYPREIPNRITVRTIYGRTVTREVGVPKGHALNPMTDQEVESKYNRLTAKILSEEMRNSILDIVWRLDKLDNLGELVKLLGCVRS
jgi:2-methylcitrate dehydratase